MEETYRCPNFYWHDWYENNPWNFWDQRSSIKVMMDPTKTSVSSLYWCVPYLNMCGKITISHFQILELSVHEKNVHESSYWQKILDDTSDKITRDRICDFHHKTQRRTNIPTIVDEDHLWSSLNFDVLFLQSLYNSTCQHFFVVCKQCILHDNVTQSKHSFCLIKTSHKIHNTRVVKNSSMKTDSSWADRLREVVVRTISTCRGQREKCWEVNCDKDAADTCVCERTERQSARSRKQQRHEQLNLSDNLKLFTSFCQGCSKQLRKDRGKSQSHRISSKELTRLCRSPNHSHSMTKVIDGKNGSSCFIIGLEDSSTSSDRNP